MYLRIRRSRRPPVAPPLVLEEDERLVLFDSGIEKEVAGRVRARWFPSHQEIQRLHLKGVRHCRRRDPQVAEIGRWAKFVQATISSVFAKITDKHPATSKPARRTPKNFRAFFVLFPFTHFL